MRSYPLVDFHSHYISGRLSAPEALLSSLEEAGVEARVLNTPLEFLRDGDREIPEGTVERINDALAALVGQHPKCLYGLATVDAYSGDTAGHELRRAVRQLGLRGVFMESAKGDLLPDSPESRPTLAAAAELGVPVFLHPVADRQLDARFRKFGPLGVRLTRSTINSAALYALLQGGVFEELPSLKVVITSLALPGVLFAAGMPDGSALRKETAASHRRHVYIDTTGMDPVGVRAAIDIVGADHVVMGTDWPVVREKAVPARLHAMFESFGLSAEERRNVAGANALRLLGVT